MTFSSSVWTSVPPVTVRSMATDSSIGPAVELLISQWPHDAAGGADTDGQAAALSPTSPRPMSSPATLAPRITDVGSANGPEPAP